MSSQTHFAMDRVAWLTCLLALAHGRIYERCELARDLQSLGVNPKRISTWVCIAFHESRFDTAATNTYSGDHGIFQISELFWCGPGKVCNLPCSALRDADISDDLECALQIYEEHTRLQGDGFRAWVVYPTSCTHNTKKYLVDCDMNVKSSVPITRSWNFAYLDTKNHTDHKENSLPRYLEIANILRGYNNIYSRNIEPVPRHNNKIKNIDDLKIPSLLSNTLQTINEPPTTTTTLATTTVYYPPVVPWRTIETNQFRKKSLHRVKNYDKPENSQEEYPARRNYTVNSLETSTSQTRLIENFIRPQPSIVTTHKKPSTTTTILPFSLLKTKPYEISSITSVINSTGQAPHVTTSTSPLPTNLASVRTTKRWTTTRWTTISPTTIKRPIERLMSNLQTSTRPTIKLSSRNYEVTTKPAVTRTSQLNFPWYSTKSSSSSTKSQTTTSRPVLNETLKRIETTTHKPRITQSIFDLYLNPTKPPELTPLEFNSHPASKFRLNIFASGTTTTSPLKPTTSWTQKENSGSINKRIKRHNI